MAVLEQSFNEVRPDEPGRARYDRAVRALVIILGVVLFGLIAITPASTTMVMVFQAHKATAQAISGQTTTGNGAPSGPHYDLNIHGVVQGGSASIGSNGHDIFVPLEGKCNISLSPGSFQVLDPNCLDGTARLPPPNPVA